MLILGGGIHAGALSSKTMWEISEDFKVASSRRRGYVANVNLDYCSVRRAVSKAQEIKETQMVHQLEALGIPLVLL